MDKRRLSTRNRGEPPLKKRALTPPALPRAPPPPSAPPEPIEPTEQGLPLRLKDPRILPTLPVQQDANLPTQDYQTISESGVLSASIELSRQKLKEGVFDRYWEKPTKKKTVFEAPNPPKETMSKLGACSLIIEPHVFDITLYTVKENPVAYAPPQPPPLSSPQYNPFATAGAYVPYNHDTPAPPKYQSLQGSVSSQTTLPPFREGFAQYGPQGPSPTNRAAIPAPAPVVDPKPPSLPMARSTSQQVGAKDQDGEPKQDPVIQMLATRAASDHGLKTLMKVVASGQASSTQLKDFQDHIDELNTLLKSQPNLTEHLQENIRPQPPPPGGQEYSSGAVVAPSTPDNSWTQAPSTAPYSNHSGNHSTIKTEPSFKTQPFSAPSGGSKSAYTIHKPEIISIVFDFGGTGDRFSFPKFSILEYLYGGTQVIVSFLVIRRGSTAKPEKYKDNRNYYQPVTMRLSTSHPKVLEPLAKVVAPPDEVRRYMDSVFDKMSAADTVFLATRLPRAQDIEGPQKLEPISQPDPQVLRPVYSPPNSIMPLAA